MILPYYKEIDEKISIQHITEDEYLDEPLISIFLTPSGDLVKTIPYGPYQPHMPKYLYKDIEYIHEQISKYYFYEDDLTIKYYKEQNRVGLHRLFNTSDDLLMPPSEEVTIKKDLRDVKTKLSDQLIALKRNLQRIKSKGCNSWDVYEYYHYTYNYNKKNESPLREPLIDKQGEEIDYSGTYSNTVDKTIIGLLNLRIAIYNCYLKICNESPNPKKTILKHLREVNKRISLDILVQYNEFDKLESLLNKSITTSRLNPYEYFYNYLINDYNIYTLPKLELDKTNNEFISKELNDFSYSNMSMNETKYKEEIELIKNKVPLQERHKYEL